mmetsp:Transcript_114/g.394  ORF Transcript_114/g.394 Transcript_114/m.394 type:complete len:218 (-) Transcript_114:483-1136(-)
MGCREETWYGAGLRIFTPPGTGTWRDPMPGSWLRGGAGLLLCRDCGSRLGNSSTLEEARSPDTLRRTCRLELLMVPPQFTPQSGSLVSLLLEDTASITSSSASLAPRLPKPSLLPSLARPGGRPSTSISIAPCNAKLPTERRMRYLRSFKSCCKATVASISGTLAAVVPPCRKEGSGSGSIWACLRGQTSGLQVDGRGLGSDHPMPGSRRQGRGGGR